ncbi:MAG: hypothetical protein KUL83_02755 [Lentimicrobium sp.]|jgi:hypothetical protein|nr:hypothetical protein [Lentimicrobium sp.]MDD4599355.1 hypothetical protein [Lentimicrobiaceae bacterium]HAH59572.1 hypothetical protein [Bacteroidales bacterium]
MKRIFTGIIFLAVWQSVIVAQTEVTSPNKTHDVFQAALILKYPDASEVIWSPNYEGRSVSFKSEGQYIESVFDEKATWICTLIPAELEQLPQPAKDTLVNGSFKTWQKGSVYYVKSSEIQDYFKILVYSPDWHELELNYDLTGKSIEAGLP